VLECPDDGKTAGGLGEFQQPDSAAVAQAEADPVARAALAVRPITGEYNWASALVSDARPPGRRVWVAVGGSNGYARIRIR
jgi:hypothetical protein